MLILLFSLSAEDIRDELMIQRLSDRKKLRDCIDKLKYSLSLLDKNVSIKIALDFAEELENQLDKKSDTYIAVKLEQEELDVLQDEVIGGFKALSMDSEEVLHHGELKGNKEAAKQAQDSYKATW